MQLAAYREVVFIYPSFGRPCEVNRTGYLSFAEEPTVTIMSVEIITKEDLQIFRQQLLEDLRKMLQPKQPVPVREVLRSAEVRRLLKISPATLQTLRINGTLPYTKVGGSLYYRLDDINKLLSGK